MPPSDSAFPVPDKLKYLSFLCGDQGAPCDHLIEYNGVRYHLRLEFNDENRHSAENTYLQKCYDAFERDDEYLDDYVYDCLDLFWPFVQENDAARHMKGNSQQEHRTDEAAVVKIQVKTIGSYLQAVEHQHHFKYPRVVPVENTFSGLTLFSSAEVERIGEIDYDIYKVMIRGIEYCLKTVYRTSESSFTREVEKLQQIGDHSNVVKLIGIVDAGNGRVDGLVLGLISGIPLSDVTALTMSQKEKWKRQISETIYFLHRRDLVWGDAKPANILIDENTDDAVLIDFGGGITEGWVDLHLNGTKKGDMQGLDRIMKYLDNLDGEEVTSNKLV